MDPYAHHQIQSDSFDQSAFVELDEAARRMNMRKSEVMELVRHRTLRCQWLPGGEPLVEPAILTGATGRKN